MQAKVILASNLFFMYKNSKQY